jgi:hypothetical protein
VTSPAPYQPGDRIALVATGDTCTRLRPGDQGTVTRWDPAQGQFSDHRMPYDASELVFRVADMSVMLTGHPAGSADEAFRPGGHPYTGY